MNQPELDPETILSDRLSNGHIGLKTSATLGDSWPDRRPQLEGIEMFDKQGLERQISGERPIWSAGQVACRAHGGHRSDGGRVRARWRRGPQATIKDPTSAGRAASDFSSLKDWNLKGENIVPHGVNPLYYPIVPGHNTCMSGPITRTASIARRPWSWIRTEDFDIPGIGKFKTAVVQEEEYLDGVLTQRALNWFALDKTTNSVYVLRRGELGDRQEGATGFCRHMAGGRPRRRRRRRTGPVDARHFHGRRPLYLRRQQEPGLWRLREHGKPASK